jgi:membrane protease YdiL (CAAX protease family)
MQNYKNQQPLLAGMKAGEKFLFSIVILFILGLVFQLLGAFIASVLYGYGFTDILTLSTFDDPRYVAASKLIQILGSLGTFIIPAFLFSYLFTGDLFSFYRFGDPVGWRAMALTVLMMVSVIPLINYLAEINYRMEIPLEGLDRFLRSLEEEAELIMSAFTSTRSLWGLTVNLLMIGMLAAIGEELIFRGLIQRLLNGMLKNIHIAIFITSIIFSAFHFQFFSFLPRLILGIILGYLMHYGRSIWFPIVAHFVNNTMGVIYYYFNSKGSADDMLEEIGTSSMMPMAALISLLLFAGFFLAWLYRVRQDAIRSPRSLGPETD